MQPNNETALVRLAEKQLDYFLLDGSSSMAHHWWETIGAIKEYVQVLRARNVESHGMIQLFDSRDLDCTLRDGALDSPEWASLDDLGYGGGMTPLYDAIGVMCYKLRDMDPKNCSIVIVTDGDENGSHQTDDVQARAFLDWCRGKGWQVTFIGCDFNNSTQAKLLGADESNSVGVRRELLTEAGKLLGQKRANHAQGGDDINFSEDEKKKFGGYLTNGNSK
jgi:hypothetical protein